MQMILKPEQHTTHRFLNMNLNNEHACILVFSNEFCSDQRLVDVVVYWSHCEQIYW